MAPGMFTFFLIIFLLFVVDIFSRRFSVGFVIGSVTLSVCWLQ